MIDDLIIKWVITVTFLSCTIMWSGHPVGTLFAIGTILNLLSAVYRTIKYIKGT